MANAAVTVQLAVMAPVVYTPVAVSSAPLQPLTLDIWYPVFGVSVNMVVALAFTVTGVDGLIVPPVPALAVTVYVEGAKLATMVQLALTGSVL